MHQRVVVFYGQGIGPQWGGKRAFRIPTGIGGSAPIPDPHVWRYTASRTPWWASYFDLPAQLHDPVRGDAEKLGRVQGEVTQEDEQPGAPCQENE